MNCSRMATPTSSPEEAVFSFSDAGGGKDGIVEIQSECRNLLMAALQQLGYTDKRVGG